ncbi:DUF7002 family protein [Robertmurraya sp.]|uniref:DUF7002 family protein n=1 Tax=Robertmurraya sp. TaxID=2837525 RepID=UPI003703FC34
MNALAGKLRRNAFDVTYKGQKVRINFQLPINDDKKAYGSEQNAIDFRKHLNQLVFLWRSKTALKDMIKRYKTTDMMILRINSLALLNQYIDKTYLTNHNSGAHPKTINPTIAIIKIPNPISHKNTAQAR